MKTKQKIINQAIKSFNIHGIKNVTHRDIAKAINISVGNLDYHFKNKEALLIAIYEQMVKDVSGIYQIDNSDPFLHFNELLNALEESHNKYSFFNLDLLEISRNFKEVDALLKKTLLVRKEQVTYFIKLFKEYDYFKPEKNEGMYMRLQHTMRILITFWRSQQEILSNYTVSESENMTFYIWELLLPHMTEKGLIAYKNFSKK
ncbi:TetR/AcrR family transcriptional regulator [Polaribacter haliotis]|uniref:TetR/AcrR family transcriptional regulator n=1 Tax=Polaribacter haliotis TaxID=1888915 RepID=UPI001C3D3692|nr:TetR/AcrR family transcriptional regulator [Polaribacter haliotis]